ncbi:uncharacterized protein LOC125650062 isoform X1 [Ostrea edulis]|uniref:uncharacterized protein LOC125650062 isoform X1 n=1 Tax=Ostrea edulis TaxID=37623 RepID=UPI00209572C6|nr:uncharacterized protein LOC125650062 isoform X1 [Ostrea edulis]
MDLKWPILALLVTLVVCSSERLQKVSSLQFLVTVNTTFNDCIATIKTPWLKPGSKGEKIYVGGCDEGPLNVSVGPEETDSNSMYVHLTFHSSVIEDASPPSCIIPFNGTYLVPTAIHPGMSLLPNCFVMDSREGYHMTYYWFKIFDWNLG